jgi:predicted anti-sigma-YlaC factor YlaD
VSFSATDCARARESLSAQLDGEPAELDRDRLELHLLVCPACATWAADVQDATRLIREAPFEEPSERFVLRGRRRSWRVGSAVALASAAAVVATMFFGPGQHASVGSEPAVPQISGFVGVTGQHFVVSRLTRLEDGVFVPVSTAQTGFQHV